MSIYILMLRRFALKSKWPVHAAAGTAETPCKQKPNRPAPKQFPLPGRVQTDSVWGSSAKVRVASRRSIATDAQQMGSKP